MAGPAAEDAQRVESVVRRPFPLERVDGPVPHRAVRVLLAKRVQLSLEVGLGDFEGGVEVDVGGGSGTIVGFFHCSSFLIPGLTRDLRATNTGRPWILQQGHRYAGTPPGFRFRQR